MCLSTQKVEFTIKEWDCDKNHFFRVIGHCFTFEGVNIGHLKRSVAFHCTCAKTAYGEFVENGNTNMFKVRYPDMLFSNTLQRDENGSFGDTSLLFWGWRNWVKIALLFYKLPWLWDRPLEQEELQVKLSNNTFLFSSELQISLEREIQSIILSWKCIDILDSLIGCT